MNLEEKKRISQNLSSLKEHLCDLDPVIDRLIEKEVFKLEHRDQIEQAGSHQKQVNEFIKILTSSPNSDAYVTFIDALHSERFYGLVEKIQSTPVFQRCMSSASTTVPYIEVTSMNLTVSEFVNSIYNCIIPVRHIDTVKLTMQVGHIRIVI